MNSNCLDYSWTRAASNFSSAGRGMSAQRAHLPALNTTGWLTDWLTVEGPPCSTRKEEELKSEEKRRRVSPGRFFVVSGWDARITADRWMKAKHVLRGACFSREFTHRRTQARRTHNPDNEQLDQPGTKTTRAAALPGSSALPDLGRPHTKPHEPERRESNAGSRTLSIYRARFILTPSNISSPFCSDVWKIC